MGSEAGMCDVPDKEGERRGLGVDEMETADGDCSPERHKREHGRGSSSMGICSEPACGGYVTLYTGSNCKIHTHVQAKAGEMWMGSGV